MPNYEVELLFKWIADLKEAAAMGKEIKQDKEKVEALQGAVKNLRRSAVEDLGRVAGGFKRIGLGLAAFGAAGLFGIGRAMRDAFKSADEMNDYRDNLETIIKDHKEVNRLMEYTAKASFRLPFPKDDIQEAIRLMTIFGYKPEEWMTTFGDAALTAKTSLATIAEAFGKARVTGGQSLRMLTTQLAITDDQIKAFGWSGKAGDVAGFERSLKRLIEVRFGGRMAKEMGEAGSAINSFRAMISWLKAEIGKPLFAALGKDLTALRDKLLQLYETGKLQKWVKTISDAFMTIYGAAKKFLGTIWSIARPFIAFLDKHPQLAKWVITTGALVSALALMGGGLLAVGGQLTQWAISIGKGIGLLKNLYSSLSALSTLGGLKLPVLGAIKLPTLAPGAGMLGMLKGGLAGVSKFFAAIPGWGWAVAAALAVIGVAWHKNLFGFQENTKRGFFVWVGIIKTVWREIVEAAGAAIEWLQGAWGKAIKWMVKAVDWIKGAWASVREFVQRIFTPVIEWLKAAWSRVAAAMNPIVAAVKKIGEKVWEFITWPVKQLINLISKALGAIGKVVPQVKAWAAEMEAIGRGAFAGPGLPAAPEAVTPPAPGERPGRGEAWAGAGAGGGAGGPSIQNTFWYLHQHFEDGSVKILTGKLTPEDFLKLMGQSIKDQAAIPVGAH